MAPRKDYTQEQMTKAIEAVRKGEKVATAAKRYGVPRITLHDKITGRTAIGCTMGPSTILTKIEEDLLVRWLIALSERHIPMTKDNLLDSVQKILTERHRPNPFTNNRPSKKWFQSFLKRHPKLAQRIPDNLTRARDNVTESNIRNWFQEIETYLEENHLKSILGDANRIFNTDESAFFLSPKPGRVIARKGEKHLYSACGDEKDNLTVLITANAAGTLAPPMIIYNYERIPASISAGVPDEWAIGKSESGWMCSSTFFEYVANIFNPWLEQSNIEKPILFFLDGHKSHLTLHLSKFCSENGIEVIALYPNSTHILQPMDLSVFRPLKVYWKKAVTEWKMENLGQNLRKENFAPVLQNALKKITKDCIKNGFRAGGLFPFGPDYLDMSKIRQRQVCEKTIDPSQEEFVKYLEREIVKIFTPQKLQLYNELFYKDRNELETKLPNEDMALYIIWAKNRSDCCPNLPDDFLIEQSPPLLPDQVVSSRSVGEQNDHSNNNTRNGNTSEEVQLFLDAVPLFDNGNNRSLPNADMTPPLSSKQVIITPAVAKQGKDITPQNKIETVQSCLYVVPSSLNTARSDSLLNDDVAPTLLLNKVFSSSTEAEDNNINTQKKSEIERHKNDRIERSDILELTVEEEYFLSRQSPDLLHDTNMDTHFLHSSEQQPVASRQCNSHIEINDVTPSKKTMEAILGITVPSPFKKSLFWPGEEVNKKKRIKREKIPSTVTSRAWKEYNEKKEMEKKKSQEEKEKRAKQRLEKKKLKEQLIKDKTNKHKLKIQGKKRTREESTSEDTDMEVTFAESDASYNLEDDEVSETENSTSKIRIKRSSYKPPLSDSDMDNLPISKLISLQAPESKKNKNVRPGNFVIVMYEGEYFPGKVENVQTYDKYEVSTMILTKGNTFRWPNTPDKIWYGRKEIVEVIKEPICLNKRGFYRILEMDKYLPDIYDH